jgi:hypothetical protein
LDPGNESAPNYLVRIPVVRISIVVMFYNTRSLILGALARIFHSCFALDAQLANGLKLFIMLMTTSKYAEQELIEGRAFKVQLERVAHNQRGN